MLVFVQNLTFASALRAIKGSADLQNSDLLPQSTAKSRLYQGKILKIIVLIWQVLILKKFCLFFSNFISFVLRLASLSCRWAPRETSSRPKFFPFCTFKIGHNYLGHKHLLNFSKYARQKKSQTEIDSYLSANRHTKIILFFDHFSNFEMRELLKIRRNKLTKGDFNNIFSRYMS